MAFLAPLFLFGLASLAVPVLIHLTHRQRREPIEFPSLMFLRRVEFKTTRRQRIRNVLLFALRALALALLVLAFSRPLLRAGGDPSAALAAAGREVVILLDGSFSMGYGDRWERARAAALRVVDGIGANDRATVVRFADRAEALTEPTSDRGALRRAIEASRPGAGVTRYAPALSLARRVIARAERPRHEVVLVSDLQRTGWTPDEGVRLPAGTTLSIVDVGGESANVAVTGVELQRATGAAAGRDQLVATVRVANRSARPAEAVPVVLTLDGRAVARQQVTIPATGAASVRLGPFARPSSVARGSVQAGRDALPLDDVRYFTIDPSSAVAVLLVHDAAASPARTLHLRRALAIGDAPGFRVDVRRSDELAAADVAGHAVVIVDDAPLPGGEAGRRIRELVSAGGGLLVVAGEHTRGGGAGAELLAASIGAPTDRLADRGGRLGTLDRSHPALEPFAGPRSGDFSAPRFFRYRPLTPSPDATTIARFDDGSVALAERRIGRGRSLVWGSTFDNVWNDLPVQPVFLPFVQQLVKRAAGWSETRPGHTVGEVLDLAGLSSATDSATAEYAAISPTGRAKRITGKAPSLELTEPGIWEVRRFGARGAPLRLVPVNVDPAESDLTRVPQAELASAIAPNAEGAAASAGDPSLTAAQREERQSLWWYLLLAAALLFVSETIVSNRSPRLAARTPRAERPERRAVA